MLYYLYSFFGINLFQYITVRAGCSFFLGFFACVWAMPKFIKWAKNKNASQPIYELAPKTHQQKGKTPTMGGLVFVSCAVFATILCAKIDNIFVSLGLFCLLGFCVVGAIDDMGKIMGKTNKAGLSPKAKMLFLIGVSSIVGYVLYFHTNITADFYVPFIKHPLANFGGFALCFWVLVLISSSNAVNLTDGLDGLAAVPSFLALGTLGFFAYVSGNIVLSSHFLMPSISGLGEVVILSCAMLGALLGFLWYNCYPAQVFMGDSGSLTIGGFLGYMAIIAKSELLLFFVGFIFVFETLSVIIQVGSFKLTGKRVFLMAPIHHHFEKKGWSENKIIVRFWTIALMSNILALATIKLR